MFLAFVNVDIVIYFEVILRFKNNYNNIYNIKVITLKVGILTCISVAPVIKTSVITTTSSNNYYIPYQDVARSYSVLSVLATVTQ